MSRRQSTGSNLMRGISISARPCSLARCAAPQAPGLPASGRPPPPDERGGGVFRTRARGARAVAGRSRTGLGGSGALAEGCRAAPGFSVPIRLDAAFAARCNTRPLYGGQVAQLVEQRTENPRVGGSIPPLATINSLNINNISSNSLPSACSKAASEGIAASSSRRMSCRDRVKAENSF